MNSRILQMEKSKDVPIPVEHWWGVHHLYHDQLHKPKVEKGTEKARLYLLLLNSKD